VGIVTKIFVQLLFISPETQSRMVQTACILTLVSMAKT
jgi:hypothetical protein